MASSRDEDEEWDKSTSEIQSEDSDYLHENRPNRWKGPPQSWRTITEEERLTYNALERLRNQDLSLHLYNAWALKQRPPPAAADEGDGEEEDDVEAETSEPVRNEPWAPPRNWTAWPIPPNELPPDDFMKTADDEDEAFTYRRPDDRSPRSRLEEVISATTLRFAKQRLRQRGITESAHEGDEGQVKEGPLSSEYESQPSEATDENEDGEEGMDVSQESEGRQRQKGRTPLMTFKPVVSTDDDVSYDLIRPSTTRILESLDRTLTILHNSRMTSAQNLEDSEASSSEREQPSHSQQCSRRGSSAERSPRKSRVPTEDEEAGVVPKKKDSRGRPRKYVQREGESERDFLIRRGKALKGKVKLPPADDDDGAASTAGESQGSPRKRHRQPVTEDKEYWLRKKLERCRPRDWKDVVGAAALAGLPPDVVTRATQRCANLFGQGMEMHRIKEVAATSSGHNGVETKTFQPGGDMPSSSSEAEEDVEDLELRQARSMSRSAATSRQTSQSSDEQGDEEGASPKKPQKRAIYRGKGQHFCPYSDCDRSLDGFDRLFNLKRHMKLVHGQDTVEVVEREADTEDMLGGVHRDGFLEPIRIQKGWRAEDTKKRAPRKNS